MRANGPSLEAYGCFALWLCLKIGTGAEIIPVGDFWYLDQDTKSYYIISFTHLVEDQ